MKVSKSEARFIAKWQKQQRSWPLMRWLGLGFSAVLIAAGAWNLHRLIELTDDQTAVAWFAPVAWVTLLAPSAWLGYILGRWRGDIKTDLLLRLIAEHEDKAN